MEGIVTALATARPLALPQTVVSTSGVTKRFGRVQALRNVDLTIRAGRVTADLGPNGAGKSTLIKLLLGLARPDRGSLAVRGAGGRTRPRLPRAPRVHAAASALPGESHRPRGRAVAARPAQGRGAGGRRTVRGVRAAPPSWTGRYRTSPGARARSSTRRSRSCSTRPCWSSTSRPPASTRWRTACSRPRSSAAAAPGSR